MDGQTLIVMHNGPIVEESYGNGGAADRIQLLASATKGFTGMLGAVAASEGIIGLDETVAQRALTEWQSDPRKSRITYRHLLTMTSGLEELNDLRGCNEYLPARAINEPGAVFIYSGDPNIFGLGLELRLGGESVVDYLNRDWVKFGEFVRRTIDGSWTGPELLKISFFNQAFVGNSAHPVYGFYWWLKRPVSSSLASTIDAKNKNQFTRKIKPIIDDPLSRRWVAVEVHNHRDVLRG